MEDLQLQLLTGVYDRRAPLLNRINQVAPWLAIHRERTIARLIELIHSGSQVLDLACGTGILASRYAHLASCTTLVDCLPKMLEIARQTLEELRPEAKLNYVLSSIASLKQTFTTREFDLVLLTQALNFVREPADVFALARSCLKDTGTLYIDIDTPLRWIAIEALSGHLENALQIAQLHTDHARHIVGTNYFFHTRDELVHAAEQHGLRLAREVGICHVSCLLHIFNQSSDFLEEDTLDPKARRFLNPTMLSKLLELEKLLETSQPAQAGGWLVLEFQPE